MARWRALRWRRPRPPATRCPRIGAMSMARTASWVRPACGGRLRCAAVPEVPTSRALHAVVAVLGDPYRYLQKQCTRAAPMQEALLERAALEQFEDGGEEAAGQIHAARGHEGH